ncbi:MAG: universal stress protein [Pyrinomonadaceae bacterium]
MAETQNTHIETELSRHAIRAEQYAAAIVRANKGSLTVCSVVPPDAPQKIVERTKQILEKAVSRISASNGIKVKSRVVENESVTRGILNESRNYDAIILGATGRRFKKILFGSVPEVIAKESLKTVVLEKRKN